MEGLQSATAAHQDRTAEVTKLTKCISEPIFFVFVLKFL